LIQWRDGVRSADMNGSFYQLARQPVTVVNKRAATTRPNGQRRQPTECHQYVPTISGTIGNDHHHPAGKYLGEQRGLAYRKLMPKRQKSLQTFQVPLPNLRLLKV
jgi:hypothetical protein